MAALATQEIDLDGVTPAYAAVAASDTFAPDDRTFLHVKNGGGAPSTVTVATPGAAALGLPLGDSITSVTNAQERMIGPFPAQHFADPTTGLATVVCSPTTSVTIGVFRAPAR